MALAGYTYALLGETFCSGVPFSQIVNGAIEPGDPLSTQEMFEEALRRLDTAATKAGRDPDVANLVQVGRGRVLLDLGRFADAGQAVGSVPDEFRFENPHSTATARTRNAINGRMYDDLALGMADREGTNGLDYVSARDPRTPSKYAGISVTDQQTPIYLFIAYGSAAAPVLVASGVEARLIAAEALKFSCKVVYTLPRSAVNYHMKHKVTIGIRPIIDKFIASASLMEGAILLHFPT